MPSSPFDHAALRAQLRKTPEIELGAGTRLLLLRSSWGLFSAKAIDEGTALLISELREVPAQGRVLDLGCGYGALGLWLAARWAASEVVLLDTDLRAVETTRANIDRNGLTNAQAFLSPGTRDAPTGPYDLIVANIPAQAGNEALDELLLDAFEGLRPGGSLVLVAVNGLRRYLQRRLRELFGDSRKARQGPRHTVLEATRA